ncbi:MAG: hypothetical protein BWZ10_01512 [candidate division BRC1 bacterium ADurb.BinA364]|nr:MAG: hypothetical protein BWZ10_01512 [candidate division BRC1 bacterium ADurb.BinA364]
MVRLVRPNPRRRADVWHGPRIAGVRLSRRKWRNARHQNSNQNIGIELDDLPRSSASPAWNRESAYAAFRIGRQMLVRERRIAENRTAQACCAQKPPDSRPGIFCRGVARRAAFLGAVLRRSRRRRRAGDRRMRCRGRRDSAKAGRRAVSSIRRRGPGLSIRRGGFEWRRQKRNSDDFRRSEDSPAGDRSEGDRGSDDRRILRPGEAGRLRYGRRRRAGDCRERRQRRSWIGSCGGSGAVRRTGPQTLGEVGDHTDLSIRRPPGRRGEGTSGRRSARGVPFLR